MRLLDLIQIPEPCSEDWNEMTPQDRGRHCAKCDKVVVDFTSLDENQAEGILRKEIGQGNRVCGRVSTDLLKRNRLMRPFYQSRGGLGFLRRFALALVLVFGGFLFNGMKAHGQSVGADSTSLVQLDTIAPIGTQDTLASDSLLISSDTTYRKADSSTCTSVPFVADSMYWLELDPIITSGVIAPDPIVWDSVFRVEVIDIMGGVGLPLESMIEVNEIQTFGDIVVVVDPYVEDGIVFPDPPSTEWTELPKPIRPEVSGMMQVPLDPVHEGGELDALPPEPENGAPDSDEEPDSSANAPVWPLLFEPDKIAMTVHPNPAQHVAKVRMRITIPGEYHGVVYDLQGQKVAEFLEPTKLAVGEMEAEVNVSGWEPGMYILSLQGDSDRISTKLVVK